MQLFRFLVPSLLTSSVMDSLPSPFTIELNGNPIPQIGDSESTKTPARTEAGSDAAVFTLKDGRLACGGWMLGRNMTEDRSMLPKKVMWFNMDVDSEQTIQPVAAAKQGDSYVLTFGGARLIEEDGNVLATIMDEDEPARVIVTMK